MTGMPQQKAAARSNFKWGDLNGKVKPRAVANGALRTTVRILDGRVNLPSVV